MSIISNVEVTPNRIRSIFNWLLQCKNHEADEETLKRFLIPAPYNGSDQSKNRQAQFVNPNLLECVEVGMIERIEGKIKLTEKALQLHQKGFPFSLLFAELLFEPDNDRNDGYLLTQAWVLSLDPKDAPSNWNEFEEAIKKAGVQSITGVTNSNPYGNFVIWSAFLGFGWKYQRSNAVLPDPTEHLLLRIKHTFDTGTEVPVINFLSKLKETVPVLDGGHYRSRVEAAASIQQSHQLSKSLSLALMRLHDLKIIKLVKKSDTDSKVTAREFGGTSISHIYIH